MKKLLHTLLLLSFGLLAAQAEEPKEIPKPDLRATDISAPKGMVLGPANEITVVVDNLVKDSKFEGKVKVELVVIQADPKDRASYFTEVDAMEYRQKRVAVFKDVEARSSDSVRLLAIVDPDKAIDESNEENNRRIYTVWIHKDEPVPTPDKPEE